MSLDLINVGTEPNDGTGDPPRVAGQKINANFQAIGQALAGLEPSTQLDARDTANRDRANHTGTQTADSISDFAAAAAAAAPVKTVAGRAGDVELAKADVGLDQVDNTPDIYKPISVAIGNALSALAANIQSALSLKLEAGDVAAFETTAQLNTRDTANRSRANHTGAQAISTVTGLQTALDAKLEAPAIANFETTTQLNARDTANRNRGNHTGTQPASTITGLTYGFTYDQQAEPAGPAAGATWRERSPGGLIVGDWEWITTLAEWVAISSYDITGLTLTGSGANSFTSITLQSRKRLIQTASLIIQTGAGTFDSANSLTFTPLYQTNFSTTVLTASTAALVVNSAGTFSKTTTIGAIYTLDTIRIFRGVTGTPGASVSALTTRVRDVRQ